MSKILIVDDDEFMIMMARHILAKKYDVLTASTGAEAVEIFQRERPDMVLSDLMMPEMDGYQLQQILQEISAEPVPIMFMTADESEESESKGFELGAADYIRKPLKPDVLLRRVKNIVDHLDKIRGLEVKASTDTLTRLLNKSTAQREIGELVKKSAGALLMIDLDNFKLVNDIHGHNMGDRILIAFADLIRKIVRAEDVAGRMGGDEFIAFLQNVTDEKILRTKTEFLNAEILTAAKNLMGSDMQIPLGVSVGAVFVSADDKIFSELSKKADAALYDVKRHGKHGLAIFSETADAKKSDVEGISQMRMIFSERNVEPGAYVVDFDTFKKIFQLLARMADSFAKGLTLLQFTLPEESSAEIFSDALIHALRQSDCVSHSGKKFFALMMQATEAESEIVRDRIFSRLEKSFAEKISFEREKIF